MVSNAKLYVFEWYDSSSDNGYNEEYYITSDPDSTAKTIGPNVTYKEYKQAGFRIIIEEV